MLQRVIQIYFERSLSARPEFFCSCKKVSKDGGKINIIFKKYPSIHPCGALRASGKKKRMVGKYNIQKMSIIVSISFFTGFLFFAVYNQWIIFYAPWHKNIMTVSSEIIQKKQVTHHYFHGDKWKTEKQEMLWQESIEKNIFHVINAWLALLDEEHLTTKKTTLQSALVTSSGTVYLSFDHNILGKEDTIFKKWMLVEGLLKTIVSNGIAITHVQLLVQHQPLQDAHVDFSMPWPIHGFI